MRVAEWGTRVGDEAGGVQLSLLNGFALTCNGAPVTMPFSAQRLVAFLALHERPLLRVYVAGRLWPDTTEERSCASLRSALWRAQRHDLPVIQATGSHVCLARGLSVDAREIVCLGQRLLAQSCDAALDDISSSSFTGELLPDWYDDWLIIERERLRQLCLHVLEALCVRLMQRGCYGQAVEAGLAAVRGEPLRESAHRALIGVHLAEGNRCEAVRQYLLYCQVLDDELGLEPSPELTTLVHGLLPRVALR